MSLNRRKRNIIQELDRKKTLFGISSTFCNWYMENPQYKNKVFDYVFDRMIFAEAVAKQPISLMDLGKKAWNDSREKLEDKYVGPEKMAQLTPAQISRSRTIGIVTGIIISVIVLYLWFGGLL